MNKAGHKSSVIHMDDFIRNPPEVQSALMESDVTVIERNLFTDSLALFMFYKVRGVNFVATFDDGYSVIHPKNVSYPFWARGEIKYKDEEGVEHSGIMNPPPLTQLSWGISMSKGLQTVSQAIIDAWKHVNDGYLINHHIVMENYLGDIKPMYPHSEKETWLGWSGSLSHMDSFESSGLLRAFKKIVKKYPQVKIVITGDKRVFDLIDVDPSKKAFSGFVPKELYPSLLKTLDIFTIPLAGEYDKCRSQIKPLESMALKIPFLATDYPNYNHIKPYGNFTENGWENWVEKLSDMIENYPKYKQKAVEEDFKWAESQNIDLHVDERIKLYEHLIAKPYKYSFPPTELELRKGELL
jgi:hypothetical protein